MTNKNKKKLYVMYAHFNACTCIVTAAIPLNTSFSYFSYIFNVNLPGYHPIDEIDNQLMTIDINQYQ